MSLELVTNECLAPGCCERAASGFLLCWDHWRAVPKDMRDDAWAARKAGMGTDLGARDMARKRLDVIRLNLITTLSAQGVEVSPATVQP